MSFSAVIQGLAALLTPVAGGFAPALAIVLFTMFVRALISPLTYLQVRAERRRAALAPWVEELRAKHTGNPAELLAQTFALHRAHGAGLLVTLLPALAQAPFFLLMYRTALHPPAGALFGVPLTAHLLAGLPVFAVLLLIAAVLARHNQNYGKRARWSSHRLRQQATVLRFLPYLTVPVVAWLPLAGALYLVTSTAWTAFEQALWRRPVPTGNQ